MALVRRWYAAVVYNMGVCNCERAVQARQQMEEDGAKLALAHYSKAAACFGLLHTRFSSVLGEPLTADLTATACRALEKIMLAEAQELYLASAQAKETSSQSALAKLASGARALWQEAQHFLAVAQLTQKLGGKWAPRIECRVHWLTAEAERAQAAHCMDPPPGTGSLEMGEAVARLRIARDALASAVSGALGLGMPVLHRLAVCT